LATGSDRWDIIETETVMRITSIRQQFIADHSSTNYFFYAAKALSGEAQSYVNTLSSHVEVGDQTAEITYHGDFADLGDTRRKKFLEHYDVEVRESYDWWTLSVMLEPAKLPDIKFDAFESEGESSLTFEKQGKWICLRFEGWHQSSGTDMEELAKLGVKLRAELYAGKTDALAVMHHYCAEGAILQDRKSPVAKKLASILDVV
jgi:hypothetical protein